MLWFMIAIGLIQAVVEFLPISSSAHLLIFGHFFDQQYNFELYVLMNFGTLGALCFFNRHILAQLFKDLSKLKFDTVLKLILSTLPTVLIGFFLLDFVKDLSTNLILISIMLVLVGALMLLKPPKSDQKLSLSNLPWSKVSLVAVSQIFALIPGVSRLGITTLSGIWQKIDYETTLRWSFLLAIPLVFGALLRVLLTVDGVVFVQDNLISLVGVNMLVFLVSLIVIELAFKFLLKYSLKPFGFYRIGLGIIIFSLSLFNVL